MSLVRGPALFGPSLKSPPLFQAKRGRADSVRGTVVSDSATDAPQDHPNRSSLESHRLSRHDENPDDGQQDAAE
jgi:hypothetical protein